MDQRELEAKVTELSDEAYEYAEQVEQLHERVRELEADRDKLRSIIESCCECVWDGCDIDGGDFQDWLVADGLLVEVPASEDFAAEWGEDATMYSLVWKGEE